MNAVQMRTEVSKAYSGPSWVNRVKKMSDKQVLAVYMRLRKSNKI